MPNDNVDRYQSNVIRIPTLSTSGIRKAFLNYFKDRRHVIVPGVPLLAKDDPSLLFVNSGMVPFKECFKGNETRHYKRAVSCQRSLRVSGKHNDYEQIGTTTRHHTFFEMLGNFSLGDYFIKEAIEYAWDFLTNHLKLPKEYLWVSVHENDEEAERLWQELTDVSSDRIVKLGDAHNLWSMGDVGPYGYSSEIFFYMGNAPEKQSVQEFLMDDGTYLEIWNLVFMRFNKFPDGTTEVLPKPCIDTGMGIERIASVIQGVKSNYDTDIIRNLLQFIEGLSQKKYSGNIYGKIDKNSSTQQLIDTSMRVLADHSRAITFLVSDGVIPGNTKESYVLRRLIRRAVRHGDVLGMDNLFLAKVCDCVVDIMSDFYPELLEKRALIGELVNNEERQFRNTLLKGLSLLNSAIEQLPENSLLSGEIAFKLYDTFGFPLDLTQEILHAKGIKLDLESFDLMLTQQKERSKVSKGNPMIINNKISNDLPKTNFVGYNKLEEEAELLHILKNDQSDDQSYGLLFDRTPFYAEMGGQIGDTGQIEIGTLVFDVEDTQRNVSGQIIHRSRLQNGQNILALQKGDIAKLKVDESRRQMISMNHTATHLLGAGLRKILGAGALQKGALTGRDSLRFDFSALHALTKEQFLELEEFINTQIRENHPVVIEEMSINDAKKQGAIAVFGEKYGDVVRVVSIGHYSMELCGGTHVNSTGNLGSVVILNEIGIGSGIRRVEALSGPNTTKFIRDIKDLVNNICLSLNVPQSQLSEKIAGLQGRVKQLSHEIHDNEIQIAELLSKQINTIKVNSMGYKYIVSNLKVGSKEIFAKTADSIIATIDEGIVVLGNIDLGVVLIRTTGNLPPKLSANNLAKEINVRVGTKGGGNPKSATIAGVNLDNIDVILSEIEKSILM